MDIRTEKKQVTYQEAYTQACEILEASGIEDARTDSWILLEHVTGLSRALFYADGYQEMADDAAGKYLKLVAVRSERIPVQHLTGEQEFMGLTFQVNSNVLVPRQDTEILVEQAERVLRPGMKVLDMCTGSGCIAVSLKVRNKELSIAAADISAEALDVARQNAQNLEAKITFVHSDMFSNIEGTFDMIISNPPYIPTEEIERLADEVKLHDPYGALDGREDGLHFYRILAGESPKYLKQGGYLYMEIGYDQSRDVEMLLKEAGFTKIRTQKDLAGLDRVVTGVYNKQ